MLLEGLWPPTETNDGEGAGEIRNLDCKFYPRIAFWVANSNWDQIPKRCPVAQPADLRLTQTMDFSRFLEFGERWMIIGDLMTFAHSPMDTVIAVSQLPHGQMRGHSTFLVGLGDEGWIQG